MMAVLAVRIAASPDAPDATALEVNRENVQEAIRDLSPRSAHVEHE
jgi:hypothetical protein